MQPYAPTWKFITWRIIYTIVLSVWTVAFFLHPEDVGTDPGYLFAFFGVIPSVGFGLLAFRHPMLAYKGLFIYGLFLIAASITISFFAYGFLWLVVCFPIYGFVVEGLLLYISYPMFRRHSQV